MLLTTNTYINAMIYMTWVLPLIAILFALGAILIVAEIIHVLTQDFDKL